MAQSLKAPRSVDPLAVPLKPLSIRSLGPRRHPSAVDLIQRVRGEFVEMRGFSPTVDQAARLFHLTFEECQGILRGLVQEGFLRQTPDGRYRLPS